MKVIILAGGYGTRLSEETEILPKPMIEIGGKPLLWHLMKIFSSQGLSHFVVALGYKGEVIKRYFLHYPQMQSDLHIDLSAGVVRQDKPFSENWRIDLVETGRDTMTGGRLKRLARYIDDTIIFTYGDGLSNIDVKRLLAFHRSHGKLATVSAVRPVSRFGILDIDENKMVRTFSEKPVDRQDLINGGFFVLEPGALDYIDDDSSTWEGEPCRRLARDHQMAAYCHDGYWQCVDTLHELRLLRETWNSGSAPWKIWD